MTVLQIIELIATLFGIANVYLLTKQKIWAWPAGIVMVSLYVYIFAVSRLYSDVILHVIYVLLNIYGWWNWSRKDDKIEKLKVTHLRDSSKYLWGGLIIFGTVLWGWIMDTYTDASFAYFDAFTTVASLSAQYLLAKKKIENWIIWIIVDIVAVNIYFFKDLYLTAGLYVLFMVLCVSGLINWRKSMQTQN